MTSDITTLYHRVVSKARVYPQRIALVINDEPVTYAELVACASATAQSLSRAGVTPGSRVGVLTQSKKDVIAGILATFALGAIAVPLSGETRQIDELLADQDLNAIVGSQSALVRFRSVAQMALVEIAHVRADAVLRDLSGLSGNVTDTAVIIRSSGTTSSEPKYIEISYRGLTAMVAYLNRLVAIPEGGVEYLNSPAQHAFGLGRVHAVLTRGGTLVSDDGIFNPLRALSAIRKYQCSSMSGVASTFDLLLDKFAGPFSDYGRESALARN